MDKLIYLILNKKNDFDDNYNINMLLKNNTINYVFADINNIDKIYYNKKDKTVYVKDKKNKLKYCLYWIYKQKKYEYVYVINNNDNIKSIIFDEIIDYRFYANNFKKEKKLNYPLDNYIIDKKCIKILLLSLDKIINTNKMIAKLFRDYKIFLNKSNKNIEQIHVNQEQIHVNQEQIHVNQEQIHVNQEQIDVNKLNIEQTELIKINMNNNIKENKILYVVLCCDNKPIYINNQNRIIKMLENAKVDYLCLKGNSESIIYNKESKTLFVDVVDVYENLPNKIYKSYEWIYNNTDYDYIYKIDDNFNFTEKNKLPNEMYDYYGNFMVKNLNRKWHFGKCSNNELNNLEYAGKFIAPYAAGGLGYILSRKSLEILLKNKEFFYDKNEFYEDKIVGDILHKNNIFSNNIEYKPINNKQNTSLIVYDLNLNKKLNNKNLNDILVLNSLNLLINKFEKKNNNSNIIISLSVIPPRFITNEFILVIDSLYNQILKPEKIVINICHKYRRKFDYNNNKFDKYKKYLLNKYDNIIINYTIDYGPITKILGLYNIINNFSEENIIICLDDDWIMNNKLTYYYSLIYQLYNCDCVFIDERDMIIWDKKYFSNMNIQKKENIFFDNYQNFVYGWLSFSFKLKHINELYNFYNKIITIDENIINHDDLILTLFYKTMNLYACGINIIFNNIKRLKLDDIDALRTNAWTLRNDLEIKFLNNNNIKYIIKNNHVYIENLNENKSRLIINKKINKRNLLLNIENINIDPSKNNFQFRHIDIKYFNKKIFILTLTIFEDLMNEKENYIIRINNNDYEITLSSNKFSKKMSFFIINKFNLDKIIYENHNNYNIIQTKENNNFSLYNFYATSTILNNLPEFEYKFFDNNDRIEFFNNYNPLITNLYNKLNVGAYKADLFRAFYIYLNGGIYFDCKDILFTPIYNLLKKEYCFCKDLNEGICNGFFYCKKNYEEIYNYISAMIQNIFFNYYTDDFLGITGPKLFGKFIKKNIDLLNNIPINNNWKLSYITDKNNKIIIKNSYNGYYEENNYLEKEHYSVKWHNRDVYLQIPIDYNKINFIKHIVWINLDRSTDRKDYMEKILFNLNVPNTRISATDGREEPVREYINPRETLITNYEIACSLSHIKCINYLYELETSIYNNGENNYYIVCEDDISLETLNLFNYDLKEVIINCPNFDILLIYKTFHKEIVSQYVEWNIEFNKGGDNHIAGTACYIISSEGIKKSIQNFIYKENLFTINKPIEVADIMIYRDLRTYVYKYNYIGTLDNNSTIHNDHLNWHKKCYEIQNMIAIKNNIII